MFKDAGSRLVTAGLLRKAALQEGRRRTQEERETLKDEAVEALPEGYFREEFEPPLFELQGMPPNFQVATPYLIGSEMVATALACCSWDIMEVSPDCQEPHSGAHEDHGHVDVWLGRC